MIGLTPRQHECLTFIAGYQAREGGVSPSYREIAEGIGAPGISSVASLLGSLEARGYVRRLLHRARAIEVLCAPGVTRVPSYPRGFSNERGVKRLPILGRINLDKSPARSR